MDLKCQGVFSSFLVAILDFGVSQVGTFGNFGNLDAQDIVHYENTSFKSVIIVSGFSLFWGLAALHMSSDTSA